MGWSYKMSETKNENVDKQTLRKKDFIVRQLGRTKYKKLELYAVTRIIHLLNDFDIKFITQQYVIRPDNYRALTDLYFPQFGLHIEVDEPHHLKQEEADKLRSADIINATNHKIERIDMGDSLTLQEINIKIDLIVNLIKKMKRELKSDFVPWDLQEYETATYIKKGYIDIKDDSAFRTIKDACNCFGHNYNGWYKGGATHPFQEDTILWFPKLYENGDWLNSISNDENEIREKNKKDRLESHIDEVISKSNNQKHKRIVFAHVKDNLGQTLYRFRGKYQLNIEKSTYENGLVWERTKTKVKTYEPINT